jgi:uncharacterized sulfatase
MRSSKNSFFLSLLCVAAVHAAVSQPVPERPNIVLIISDDQAYHDFGFMGHEQMNTPNLDRLADESLVFTRGYVTTALCSPSLASILTGAYPHQHGYTGNDPVKGWDDRTTFIDHFSQFPQLPRLLADHGYVSLHTGKFWQGNPLKVSGFTDTLDEDQHRHGSPKSLQIGREGIQPIYDFIEKARAEEKPFLVWYAPFLPHTPHTPPERLLEKNEGRKYHAMVEWLDESCGELLDYLDEQGLRENTIVLFISDNGWPEGAFGQYRGIVAKFTPWEQGVRTPIMIRWPGRVAPERNEENLAVNLDIPVTILSALGIAVPETMEGINLLDEQAVASRACIFLEDFAHDMTAPDRPEDTLEARGVICGDWKLVEHYLVEQREIPGTYLFNLKEDPKEKSNLVSIHPEKAAELRAKLNAWWNPRPDLRVDTRPDGIATMRIDYLKTGESNLAMTVYWPAGRRPSPNPLPAAVLLPERDGQDANAISLVREGLVVVTPECPGLGKQDASLDSCEHEMSKALRFINQHAEAWNIDTNRVSIRNQAGK